MYKDAVRQDVLQRLVAKYYGEALKEHDLDPIDYPKINFDAFDEDAAFSFSAEFEVRPVIELKRIEGLDVLREEIRISDEQVSNVLRRLQEDKSELVPVFEDRPVQKGDVVKIDFEAFIEGAPLENGTGRDFDLEIGSNSFIPGFEEGLEGRNHGQTARLDLKFPDEYHSAEVAGKPVSFSVTIKAIQKKKLPDLNDDFAKAAGEFSSLDQLRNRIREDLRGNEERRTQEDLKNRIVKSLVKNNPVPVPKTLLQQQKDRLIKDMQNRMNQQGLPDGDFDEYRRKWDADFEQTAATIIQSSFLIDEIAKKLEIRPTQQQMDERVQKFSRETGIELERLEQFYSEGDRRSQLAYQIREEAVIKYLIEKAKITDVTAEQLKD
jgi:trigger factor